MKSYLLKRFLEDLKSKKQSRQLVIAHTKKSRIVNLAIGLRFFVYQLFVIIY